MPEAYDNLTSLLLVAGFLFVGCVVFSKLSSRFSMPGLLVFLLLGMGMHLAVAAWQTTGASENAVTGQLPWRHANVVGTVALAFILFSGGLSSSWNDIRRVFRTGTILSTIGVLLTTLLLGGFAILVALLAGRGDLWPQCLLFGAIVSSTDASAVFSILRSKKISLRGKLKPLLEYESGSNDPMATFLTLFFLGLCVTLQSQGQAPTGSSSGFWEVVWFLPKFVYQMGVGVAVGVTVGVAAVWLFNHLALDYDGLYYVLDVAVVFLIYALATLCHANGFMAIYAGGVYMGTRRFVFRNSVTRFADAMGWLMQVILFTMLGFMANPRVILEHWRLGLLMGLFLMFVARPLATFLCMIGSGFSTRAKTLVSWVGLRGGAPIMLATFPMLLATTAPEAAENAVIGATNIYEIIFNQVFCLVLLSVVIQSFTIMPLARLLRLDAPLQDVPTAPISFDQVTCNEENTAAAAQAADDLAYNEPATYAIPEDSDLDHTCIRDVRLPAGVFVVMIRRDGRWLVPRGETLLRAGDALTALATPANHRLAADFFAAKTHTTPTSTSAQS